MKVTRRGSSNLGKFSVQSRIQALAEVTSTFQGLLPGLGECLRFRRPAVSVPCVHEELEKCCDGLVKRRISLDLGRREASLRMWHFSYSVTGCFLEGQVCLGLVRRDRELIFNEVDLDSDITWVWILSLLH